MVRIHSFLETITWIQMVISVVVFLGDHHPGVVVSSFVPVRSTIVLRLPRPGAAARGRNNIIMRSRMERFIVRFPKQSQYNNTILHHSLHDNNEQSVLKKRSSSFGVYYDVLATSDPEWLEAFVTQVLDKDQIQDLRKNRLPRRPQTTTQDVIPQQQQLVDGMSLLVDNNNTPKRNLGEIAQDRTTSSSTEDTISQKVDDEPNVDMNDLEEEQSLEKRMKRESTRMQSRKMEEAKTSKAPKTTSLNLEEEDLLIKKEANVDMDDVEEEQPLEERMKREATTMSTKREEAKKSKAPKTTSLNLEEEDLLIKKEAKVDMDDIEEEQSLEERMKRKATTMSTKMEETKTSKVPETTSFNLEEEDLLIKKEANVEIDDIEEEQSLEERMKRKATRMQSRKMEEETSSKVPETTSNEEDLVVFFSSLDKIVPLANWIKLGYSRQDVESMEPDVLDVILKDQVPRPTSTTKPRQLPSRWLLRKGSPKPQILSRGDQAQTRMKQDVQTSAAPTSAPPSGKSLKNEEVGTKEQRQKNRTDDREKTTTRTIMKDSPIGGRGGGGRRRRSRSRMEEQEERQNKRRRKQQEERLRRQRSSGSSSSRRSTKQIYSGRSSPTQRGDPPSPNSILWMDMHRFRNLLRQEAELRIRILGPDWADVVKEESDWRLNLYKDWLWTLHNGIGSPIVPTKATTVTAEYYDYKNGKSNEKRKRRAPKREEEAAMMMKDKPPRRRR